MKKLGILLVAFLLMALVFSAIGCGGGGGGEATPTPTHTTTATKTPTATATTQNTATPGGETGTLSEILGHSKNITSVYCEMVTTEPGKAPETGKIWAKWTGTSSKMWLEGPVTEATEIDGETVAVGETVVMLMVTDATTMQWYEYYPAHHKAYDMSSTIPTPVPGTTPEPALSSEESAFDMSDWLEGYNPTIIGSEKYDGKDCLVVQYTSMGETVKMWIWKQYGIDIKTETTTDEGKSIEEIKNISFSNISDSKFQLPAGVEKIQMPGLEDLGGWGNE